ncbi:hypothetical protein J1N35_016075 [Gossypium stocksii]|uniref:Uncharacterized protein n=1 Tax=Gossypium stocksii TaxID=47602 RepID=A0A9D4AAZ1_9ROSI|nr:hypothetical protein J1N35_016075 [Gossypium stocksii]
MISAKKLIKLARIWQKTAAIKRKRITFLSTASMVEKGCWGFEASITYGGNLCFSSKYLLQACSGMNLGEEEANYL